MSDPGEATRRAVLGDEHVDRSDAAITPFSRPLTEYRTRAGWGEVWSRDGLDRRARSLVTLGVRKMARRMISDEPFSLVAGVGFEPTTSGL